MPLSTERGPLALLSALAEAPDLVAAATFLLSDVLATTGASRAMLLRFDTDDEHLVLAAHVGLDAPPLNLSIGERNHPWMVSTLTLSPVVMDAGHFPVDRMLFESSTTFPMPRPHYRGAPAIWSDSYAAELLAPTGARLVPLEDRRFSSAPGGLVVIDRLIDDEQLQELAT